LTAPGPAGAAWLAARRERYQLAAPVLPPAEQRRLRIPDDLAAAPAGPGVLTLLDASGEVLRIAGVNDLASGLAGALAERTGVGSAAWFMFEPEPLYTQRETELLSQYAREHGRLPSGNDLGDDLFAEDMD